MPEAEADPLAPVFISYRASDGRELASSLALSLRSMGLPVWLDESDLPPGDTDKRLEDALAGGLSGAVLVVTPDVEKSACIKNLELPWILARHEDPDFTFALGSTIIRTETERIDHNAPDSLLCQDEGTLSGIKQYPLLSEEDLTALARDLARRRMQLLRGESVDELTIEIQTRSQPSALDTAAGLVVRLPPPAGTGRTLPTSSWELLRGFLTNLPFLVSESGAARVLVAGGAHLSVAFAIGASLPTTTAWSLVARPGSTGQTWGEESTSAHPALNERVVAEDDLGKPVAVLLDLVDTPRSGTDFEAHVDAHTDGYSGSLVIEPVDRVPLGADQSLASAVEVSRRVREFAANRQTGTIDLFLRTSFPMALLLGRYFNTYAVNLYEWNGTDADQRYEAAIRVASGQASGPVTAIL